MMTDLLLNLTPSSHSRDILIFYCQLKILMAVVLIQGEKEIFTEMKQRADVGW